MSDNAQQSTKAYEKAIQLLGIRMHTSFELSKKLKLKGFEAEVIREVIDKLREQRYVNDEQVASAYLESLINHKAWGYYGLKSKLMQKGIAEDIITELLEEQLSLEIEEKLAEKHVNKNRLSGMKAAASLQRKGFRNQIVSKYISFQE